MQGEVIENSTKRYKQLSCKTGENDHMRIRSLISGKMRGNFTVRYSSGDKIVTGVNNDPI